MRALQVDRLRDLADGLTVSAQARPSQWNSIRLVLLATKNLGNCEEWKFEDWKFEEWKFEDWKFEEWKFEDWKFEISKLAAR